MKEQKWSRSLLVLGSIRNYPVRSWTPQHKKTCPSLSTLTNEHTYLQNFLKLTQQVNTDSQTNDHREPPKCHILLYKMPRRLFPWQLLHMGNSRVNEFMIFKSNETNICMGKGLWKWTI